MSTSTTPTPRPEQRAGRRGDQGARPASQGRPAWLLVAIREMAVKLTDRNFLISTGLTLLILIGSFGFSAFMSSRAQSPTTVVTVQPAAADIVRAAQPAWQSARTGADLEVKTVADDAAARAAVMDGTADGYLHPASSAAQGGWVLTTKDDSEPALQSTLGAQIQTQTIAANARAAGTSVEALTSGSALVGERIGEQGNESAASEGVVSIVTFVMAMLYYLASLMFGMAIASSVVEEKQSRIVEILATIIPIRQLLVGKVLGNTALAFGQMALFAAVGLVGLRFTSAQNYLGMITAPVIWYLVFFVAGFLALACIWAAAGSLASRNEDLQATTTPLTMLIVAVLFAGLTVQGVGRVIASYMPIVSTVVMPVRLFEGTASWWEALISLVITVTFAACTVLFGERLYRRSVLQTGGRLGVREALRLQD